MDVKYLICYNKNTCTLLILTVLPMLAHHWTHSYFSCFKKQVTVLPMLAHHSKSKSPAVMQAGQRVQRRSSGAEHLLSIRRIRLVVFFVMNFHGLKHWHWKSQFVCRSFLRPKQLNTESFLFSLARQGHSFEQSEPLEDQVQISKTFALDKLQTINVMKGHVSIQETLWSLLQPLSAAAQPTSQIVRKCVDKRRHR